MILYVFQNLNNATRWILRQELDLAYKNTTNKVLESTRFLYHCVKLATVILQLKAKTDD